MKKAYLHYDGNPQFTMVVRLEEDSKESADELKKVFFAGKEKIN